MVSVNWPIRHFEADGPYHVNIKLLSVHTSNQHVLLTDAAAQEGLRRKPRQNAANGSYPRMPINEAKVGVTRLD